jgi:hypothetical protein
VVLKDLKDQPDHRAKLVLKVRLVPKVLKDFKVQLALKGFKEFQVRLAALVYKEIKDRQDLQARVVHYRFLLDRLFLGLVVE